MKPDRQPEDAGLLAKLEGIEGLARELDRAADPSAHSARDLVQAVLDLHKAGLARILDRLAEAGQSGRELTNALAADELVGALLVLHDLHPLPFAERVDAALDRLRTQGCDLDVLEIHDGIVRLHLREECHLPVGAMQSLVEQALTAAVPDVTTIEFDEGSSSQLGDSASYIPLPILSGSPRP